MWACGGCRRWPGPWRWCWSPALVAPLKEWTDRPGTPAVPPAVGYYPSGHTATAVVAYGAATVLLLGRLRA